MARPPRRRGWLAAAALIAAQLAGCGSSSDAGSASTVPPPAANHNNAVVQASAEPVLAAIGSSRTVELSFDSDDGAALDDLALDAAALPPGWSLASRPAGCAQAGDGADCRVRLRYAPQAAASGTLALDYRYRDASGAARHGRYALAYAATRHNTLQTALSPAHGVPATVGSRNAVLIRFATDRGSATELDLGDSLQHLPAGFSADARSFGCARVDAGTGCTLALVYAPRAIADGKVRLAYRWRDESGEQRSGSVSFGYTATSHNRVRTTASSGSSFSTAVGATRDIDIAFTTSDGAPATELAVATALDTLPGEFASATASFRCARAGAGAPCTLRLTHAPTQAATGTLTLAYAYRDNSGTRRTGRLRLAYEAAGHNNVVASLPPALRVKVGATQTATLAFAPDRDGASDFEVTTDLNALPPGWSSAQPSLRCTSLPSSCALALSYAPAASGASSVTIDYRYTDADGHPGSGSATLAATGYLEWLYVSTPGAQSVQRCRWSETGTLADCADALLGIDFGIGVFAHGSHALAIDYAGHQARRCTVASDGTLSACTAVGDDLGGDVIGAALRGDDLYLANPIDNTIRHCRLDADSAPGSCSVAANLGVDPLGLAVREGALYVASYNAGAVLRCPIGADGALGACASLASVGGASGIAFWRDTAYVSTISWNGIYQCHVAADGSFDACQWAAAPFFYAISIAAQPGSLLLSNFAGSSVASCELGADGSIGACQATGPAFAQPGMLSVLAVP